MFKAIVHPTILKVDLKELIEFQLNWILRGVMEVNHKELKALTYVYLYGNKAPEMMVQDRLTRSEKSIENIISTFRKKGLIIGTREDTTLHEQIKPKSESIAFTVKLELNERVD